MTTPAAMQKARKHVSPGYFTDFKEKYSLEKKGEGGCLLAAGLLEIVYNTVEYRSEETGLNRGAWETLQDQEGNCVDQSVLYASLLKSQGFPARLRGIANRSGEEHMIAEVGIEGSKEKIDQDLLLYYTEASTVKNIEKDIFLQLKHNGYQHEGLNWLPCEPTGSWVVGDITGLVKDGYLDQKPDGRYKYVDCEAVRLD